MWPERPWLISVPLLLAVLNAAPALAQARPTDVRGDTADRAASVASSFPERLRRVKTGQTVSVQVRDAGTGVPSTITGEILGLSASMLSLGARDHWWTPVWSRNRRDFRDGDVLRVTTRTRARGRFALIGLAAGTAIAVRVAGRGCRPGDAALAPSHERLLYETPTSSSGNSARRP